MHRAGRGWALVCGVGLVHFQGHVPRLQAVGRGVEGSLKLEAKGQSTCIGAQGGGGVRGTGTWPSVVLSKMLTAAAQTGVGGLGDGPGPPGSLWWTVVVSQAWDPSTVTSWGPWPGGHHPSPTCTEEWAVAPALPSLGEKWVGSIHFPGLEGHPCVQV